ncbi:MAG: protein kinase [Planctomycetaceae bacterium]|nr:protein kinase [Planctomycetaceae bacterium]
MPDSPRPPAQGRGPSPADEDPLVRYFAALQAGRSEVMAALEGRHPQLAEDFRALQRTWERLGPHLHATSPELTRAGGPSLASTLSGSLGDTRMERLRARTPAEQRYEMGREIARGGMGAIRAVWDEDLRRRLAMKVMLRPQDRDPTAVSRPPDTRLVARFLEEAQITAQLDHPGILPVHEIGFDDEGRLYFTMPLVEGRHLGEIFKLARADREGWTTTRAVGVLLKVAEAVAFAHERGVVHRDLKPENVMVGRFGETYVMDWGLARVLAAVEATAPRPGTSLDLLRAKKRRVRDERVRTDRADGDSGDSNSFVTMDGDVVGTPGYMAPEQARGERASIGAPADIYAIGAILYQLLSGHAPHLDPHSRASPTPLLERILEHDPTPLRQLAKEAPEELVAIATKAMQSDPNERYPTAEALAEDLRAYLEGRVVSAYERGFVAQTKKWIVRNRVLATAYGLVALSVLAGSIAFVRQQQASLERVRDEQARTERAREDAEEAKQRAEAGEFVATQTTYAASIRAADLALRSGSAAEARRSLEGCPESLRDFEWRHLTAQLDTSLGDVAQVGADVLAADFLSDGTLAALRALDGDRVEFSVWDASSGRQRLRREFALLDSVPRRVTATRTRSGLGLALHPAGREAALGLPDGRLLLVSTDSAAAEPRELEHPEALGADADARADADFQRNLDICRHLTWSAKGEWLAVALGTRGGADVAVYEPARGNTAVRQLPRVGRRATALRFDPLVARLAVGYEDGAVGLWPMGPAEPHAEPALLLGHRTALADIVFSPDGRRLASVSDGPTGTVRIWNAGTAELLTVVRRPTGPPRRLLWAGDSLAGISEDRELVVWSAADGSQVGVQRGHEAECVALGLAQDGERLWSLDRGGRWCAWDFRVDAALTELRPRRLATQTLDLSADGSRVLLTRVGMPEVWDAEALETMHTLQAPGVRGDAYFLEAGRLAVGTTSRGAHLWDTQTGNSIAALVGEPDWGNSVFAAGLAVASGRSLAAVAYNNGRVALYELGGARTHGEELRPTRTIEMFEPPVRTGAFTVATSLHGIALSQNGAWLAVVDTERRVRLCNLVDGSDDVRTVPLDPGEADREEGSAWYPRIALDSAGRTLAVSVRDEAGVGTRIALLDLPSGRRRATLEGHGAEVRFLCYSPSGTRLASSDEGGAVRLWDAQSGACLLVVEKHRATVDRLAFSGDGSRLATISADRSVHILETTPPRRRFESRILNAAARRSALLLFGGERPMETADEPVRRAFERFTKLLVDDPARLNFDAWEVVRRPGAAKDEQMFAVMRAQAAVQATPADPAYRCTLGVAYYRVGRLRDAARELLHSIDLMDAQYADRPDRRPDRPEAWAVLALAHYELGEPVVADGYRAQYEQLLSRSFYARDADAVAFLTELEAIDELEQRKDS